MKLQKTGRRQKHEKEDFGFSLLVFACAYVSILNTNYDSTVSASPTTMYFRGTSSIHTVNGLTAYGLLSSQASTNDGRLAYSSASNVFQVGIRVWVRHSDGSESEVTSGSPVAIGKLNFNPSLSSLRRHETCLRKRWLEKTAGHIPQPLLDYVFVAPSPRKGTGIPCKQRD